jgi:hypothetical protein
VADGQQRHQNVGHLFAQVISAARPKPAANPASAPSGAARRAWRAPWEQGRRPALLRGRRCGCLTGRRLALQAHMPPSEALGTIDDRKPGPDSHEQTQDKLQHP